MLVLLVLRFDRQPFNLLFLKEVFVFLLLFVISPIICVIGWGELQCAQCLGPAAKQFLGLLNFSSQSSFDLTSCVKSQQCSPL